MTKRMREDDTYRVPVTVLTGFLGSGKTTLLNHILTAEHGRRIAVIENEFGSVGVDDSLVKHRISADEEIFAMNNGCLCCTVRGDLIKIISKLLKDHGSRFEHIIIETTGLADPAPITQTFLADDSTVADKTRIDAIICLVDAKHLLKQLEYPRQLGTVNESVQQLAFADRIILNKTDLVTAAHLEAVRQRIKSINAFAPIVATTHAKVEMSDILHVEAFSVERALQIDPQLLEMVEDHHHPHTHGHKHGHEHGHGHRHKHESRHDGGVGSVGLQFTGDINMAKLENFLACLIELNEENLYRYKGVLSVKGMNNKYVVQGVHGTYDAEFSDPWGYNEPRDNKFVFIGRHLDRDNLTKGLTACRITTDSLRFPLGSHVAARVCHGWVEGIIVATWDEGHPYRVRVLGPEAADFHSAEVWAPEDDDSYIRLSVRRNSPAVQFA